MTLRDTLLASTLALALLIPGAAAAQTDGARELLPANARPVAYAISVQPNAEAMTFKGQARIEFDVVEPTASVVMNAADLDVRSAVLDTGATPKIAVDNAAQRVTFTFDQPLSPGRYALSTVYDGKINVSSNGLFAAPYKTATGESKVMLATQFEPGDARRLAPMWDEPSHKAVFKLDVTVPANQGAMSNMPEATVVDAGAGLKRIWFEPSVKMSSYLLFLSVGELERLEGEVAGKKLGIVTKAGDKDKGQYALETTQKLLPYFNDYFGTPYALPKLDQLAVPGAGGFGAMENWGAILYFEPYLLFDPKLSSESDRQRIFGVVAHEVAHQWFGNLVTMSWWDDLWLNEGFASWMDNKASNHFNPEWKPWLQALAGQEGAMGLDALSSTHPIVQNVANVAQANLAFDAITYQKGEAVIRMLEAYIGEEAFRNGVRQYMATHAYKNTVTDDLWKALEAASGTPVTQIAYDFTKQPGVPMITVESARCEGGATKLALRQGRFAADAASKTPITWRVPVTAKTLGAGETARGLVSGAGSLTAAGCGPVVVNVERTGYYRVKYDQASYTALRDNFAKLDAADQLALLYDSWALGAVGEAPATRYLELAKRTPAEADPIVLRQIVSTMNELRELYAGQNGEALFTAYAKDTLKPMLAKVGWTAQPGEPANVSVLRSSLIQALGRMGEADVVAEARRRFAAADSDPTAMPAALRAAILSVVGANADAAGWTALKDKAAAAKSPLEQRQYLSAMSLAKDPALAKKSLDFYLTDATPKQLAPGLIAGVTGVHPDLGWRFYLERRADVDSGLDPLQRFEYGPALATASADLKRVQELKAFAAANLPADAKKAVDEAVSAITYNAGVRTKRVPEVTRWLRASAAR